MTRKKGKQKAKQPDPGHDNDSEDSGSGVAAPVEVHGDGKVGEPSQAPTSSDKNSEKSVKRSDGGPSTKQNKPVASGSKLQQSVKSANNQKGQVSAQPKKKVRWTKNTVHQLNSGRQGGRGNTPRSTNSNTPPRPTGRGRKGGRSAPPRRNNQPAPRRVTNPPSRPLGNGGPNGSQQPRGNPPQSPNGGNTSVVARTGQNQNAGVYHINTLRQWSQLVKIRVHTRHQSWAIANLGEDKVLASANGLPNPHGRSAASRRFILLYILSDIGASNSASFLSVYGSQARDQLLDPRQHRILYPGATVTLDGRTYKIASNLNVDVRLYRPRLSGDDAVTGNCVLQYGKDGDCQYLYMHDVYLDGSADLSGQIPVPLTPERLAEHLNRVQTKMGYISARPFVGYGGQSYFDDGSVEGRWFRDSEGLIHFQPDDSSRFYGGHPDINYLWEKGTFDTSYGTVCVYFERTVGPYGLFKLRLVPYGTLPLNHEVGRVSPKNEQTLLDRRVVELNPTVADYISCFSHLCWPMKTRECVVFTEYALKNTTVHQYRIPGGMQLGSMLASVHTITEHPYMAWLYKQNTDMAEEVIKDTVLATYLSRLEQDVRERWSLRLQLKTTEDRIRQLRDPKGPEQGVWLRWGVITAGVVVAGGAAYYLKIKLSEGRSWPITWNNKWIGWDAWYHLTALGAFLPSLTLFRSAAKPEVQTQMIEAWRDITKNGLKNPPWQNMTNGCFLSV